MVRYLAAAALVTALALSQAPADADPSEPPRHTSVNAGPLSFDAGATDHVGLEPSPGPSGGSSADAGAVAHQPPPPPCGSGTAVSECIPTTTCVAFPDSPTGYYSVVAFGHSIANNDFMLGPPCTPGTPAEVNLPAATLQAFQRVPLPEPTLDIQPPKGKTLIGLETIFSTKAESFTRTLNLLGRRVELRIGATSFEWRHGDETTQQTDWPGKPWREGPSIDTYITHVYEDTGHVSPSVSVTWSAEYRVDGGPWLPVNGTVTRASQPTALEIVEAEPRLVAP